MSGGEYTRWYSSPLFVIDWQNDGERIKNFKHADGSQRSAVRNEEFYFTEGLIFLKNGTVAFSPWYTPGNCVFLDTNRFIHIKTMGTFYALGFLNSTFVDHALNLLNPTGGFTHTNINRIPYKPSDSEASLISEISRRCFEVKRELLSYSLEDSEFEKVALEPNRVRTESCSLQALYGAWLQHAEEMEIELFANKAAVDGLVFDAYGFDDAQINRLMRFERTPVGWYPILQGYEVATQILPVVQKYLARVPHTNLSEEKLSILESEFVQLYGNEGKSIEEISTVLELNPVSVVALRRKLGLINPTDFKYEVENFLTHRIWELCKRDEDGIIPYDVELSNPSLLEQVQGEIEAVFGAGRAVTIEAEMDEVLGRGGLARWLGVPFFQKHVSQFRKRPILWQLTSPAQEFRILVYYHKLDRDTLRKVRGPRYLGALLERGRTQLRAIQEHNPFDLKTIGDLEAYMADLEECNRRLESVIEGTVEVELPDWAAGPYRNGQPPYDPDLDDGVMVNILPLQAAGLLPAKVV